MMKSMKKMVLVGAAVTVMVVSLAAPAMADEVQDKRNDSSGTDPIVRGHRDGSSSNSSSSSGIDDKEPLKDPGGIRLCDIAPTACQDADDSKDDHSHNSGVHPEANNPNPVKEEDTPSSEGNTIIVVDCIDPDTHQLVVCDSKDEKEKGQKDTLS